MKFQKHHYIQYLNVTHTNIALHHLHHLVPAPSNTCTTRTTSSAAKSRTTAQSATCMPSASHAARVSTTNHASASRHRRLSLVSSATTRESGHETSSTAAAIGHAGVDALLVALLVASVAFAGAETHGCLLFCVYVYVCRVAKVESKNRSVYLRN
jgi:hypothetical protein